MQADDVSPACIISPSASADVAEAVGVINLLSGFKLQCPFAIRGGGHTPWAGASTIANGIVIDLTAINQITVSKDNTVTSVGPGARWIDAYLKLDALNLAISGGRVASVGVAGLTTGGMQFLVAGGLYISYLTRYTGGMSFFAPRTGLVCDNVVNFEV